MHDIVDRLARGATWITDADLVRARCEIEELRQKVNAMTCSMHEERADEWSARAENLLKAMETIAKESHVKAIMDRDEARRLVCEMHARHEQGTPEGWANEFGWVDLYTEGECDARR